MNYQKPESRIEELDRFLTEDACKDSLLLQACYAKVRLKLIETTEALENEEANVYLLTKTIDRLINNINSIIDSFPEIDELKMK